MSGLTCASTGLASPWYETYWRPEKLLPLRYQAGCARTTSDARVPPGFSLARIWSEVALRQVKLAEVECVPQSRGPAPPPWKSRKAPPGGMSAGSVELALQGIRSPETRLISPSKPRSASGLSGVVTV